MDMNTTKKKEEDTDRSGTSFSTNTAIAVGMEHGTYA